VGVLLILPFPLWEMPSRHFPSLGNAQPAMINKIYYAKDDPNKPKSYNKGRELVVGGGEIPAEIC